MRAHSPLAPLTRVALEDDGTLRPNALLNGILAMRWGVLVWLVVLLVAVPPPGTARAAGWVALLLAAAWTVYLTRGRARWTGPVLVGDLVVAAGLLVLGAVAPSLATIYPVTAALSWGARRGTVAGAVTGALLGGVLVGANAVRGAVVDLSDERLVAVVGSALNLVLAGGGLGLVSTLVQRSARDLRAAQTAEISAREDAARAGERERLGRDIHDSVLQALTLVTKRGRELAGSGPVPAEEVAALAALAATQERELRDLLVRPRQLAGTPARSDLAQALDALAREHAVDLDVVVTSAVTHAIPPHVVAEVAAAVDQALANVARHAGTRHAWVFAETHGGQPGPELVVTVRDDGRGFVLDEDQLVAAGRLGLARSIRGRVEDLGGRVGVDSSPGRGTEIELRVPVPA